MTEQDLARMRLLHRSYSVPFGRDAVAYMNPTTYHMLRRAMLPRWYRRIWPWIKQEARRR